MFEVSLLGLDPPTYEAIIAAFILVGLIQSVALARKANQARQFKKAMSAGMKAVCDLTIYLVRAQRECELAKRVAMEAQADTDYAEAELERLTAASDANNESIPQGLTAQAFRLNDDGTLSPVSLAETGVTFKDILAGLTPPSLKGFDGVDPYAEIAAKIHASPDYQPEYHSPRAG